MKTPALLLTVLAGAVLAGCANNSAPVRVEPTYQEAASSQFIQTSRDAVTKLTTGFDMNALGAGPVLVATVVNVMSQARPATFNVLLVGFFKASRGLNAGLAPGATFDVAHAVQRRQYLLTKLGAFFENGVNHVRRCFGASWKALIVRFVAEQFVTNEANITQGGLVVRHSDKPLLM